MIQTYNYLAQIYSLLRYQTQDLIPVSLSFHCASCLRLELMYHSCVAHLQVFPWPKTKKA